MIARLPTLDRREFSAGFAARAGRQHGAGCSSCPALNLRFGNDERTVRVKQVAGCTPQQDVA